MFALHSIAVARVRRQAVYFAAGLLGVATVASAQGLDEAGLAERRDATRRLDPAVAITRHNVQAWRMATLSFNKATKQLSTFAPFEQPPASGRWALLETRIPNDTNPIPYLLHVPAGYDARKPTPLLVYLHDAIARPTYSIGVDIERDEASMVRTAHEKGWLVLWPLANRQLNWVEHLASLRLVESQIDAVRRQYNVDEARIWVGGTGDGGRGALWFATRNQNVAAATFHIATMPTIAVEGGTRVENAANAARMFAVSGAADALFTAATVEPFWQALQAARAPLVHVIVPGVGHGLAAEWSNIAWVYDSLGAMQRTVVPRTLQWSTATLDEGRRSWLTIAGLDPLVPIASVRATVKGNLISIETTGVTSLRVSLVSTLINFKKPIRVSVNDHEVYHAKISPSSGVMVQEYMRTLERTAPVGAVIDVDVRKRKAHVERG